MSPAYTAHNKQDNRTLQTLLGDAAKYPKGTRWADVAEFNLLMGPRPNKAALLKRNSKAVHGPGNSYWSTDAGCNTKRNQDKAIRAARKREKIPDQHPQTKTALKAFLAALQEAKPKPQIRARTQKENDQQAALLLEALRGPERAAKLGTGGYYD